MLRYYLRDCPIGTIKGLDGDDEYKYQKLFINLSISCGVVPSRMELDAGRLIIPVTVRLFTTMIL